MIYTKTPGLLYFFRLPRFSLDSDPYYSVTQINVGPGPQHVVDAPNVMVVARTLIQQALTITASIPSIVPGRQTITGITVYSTSRKKRCAQQSEYLMLSSERLASDQGRIRSQRWEFK